MTGAANVHTELDALRTDLHKTSGSMQAATAKERILRKDNDQAATAPGPKAELEEPLRELGKMPSGHTGRIDDFVKEHQLASALAAFVPGVAVGRLMRRA
jgi:hypothetical protein